jgi:hypothetical protein
MPMTREPWGSPLWRGRWRRVIIAARRVAFPLRRNPEHDEVPVCCAALWPFRVCSSAGCVRDRQAASRWSMMVRSERGHSRVDCSSAPRRSSRRVPHRMCRAVSTEKVTVSHSRLCTHQPVIPNAILVLIGDGELKTSIGDWFNNSIWKGRCFFLGLSRLGSAAGATYLCSTSHEGLGSSLLVAMACEVPTVPAAPAAFRTFKMA